MDYLLTAQKFWINIGTADDYDMVILTILKRES
jgi:hypothetical protein